MKCGLNELVTSEGRHWNTYLNTIETEKNSLVSCNGVENTTDNQATDIWQRDKGRWNTPIEMKKRFNNL